MFKITAQTLLISVVALNACYAMEDEKPNEKKGGFFNKLTSKFSKKDEKKKNKNSKKEVKTKNNENSHNMAHPESTIKNNTNSTIEIKSQNDENMTSASDDTMEDSESSLSKFNFQLAPICDSVQNTDKGVIITLNAHKPVNTKEKLIHKYLCAKETLEKVFPPELISTIVNLAYHSAKYEPEYAFPSENAVMDMASYLSKSSEVEVMNWNGLNTRGDIRWYLFKVGGMTIIPVQENLLRSMPPAQGLSIDRKEGRFFRLGEKFSSEQFLHNDCHHFTYSEKDLYSDQNRGESYKAPFYFRITEFDDLEGNPIDLSDKLIVLKPLKEEDKKTLAKSWFVAAEKDNFVFKIEKK